MNDEQPQYTLAVNRHDGPHNYLKIRQADARTLIAVTDCGITVADDLTPDETKMVIRTLAESVRNLYLIQEGR